MDIWNPASEHIFFSFPQLIFFMAFLILEHILLTGEAHSEVDHIEANGGLLKHNMLLPQRSPVARLFVCKGLEAVNKELIESAFAEWE